ncbi:MAG: type IX secretion system membrane protein PorP/SprF [Opitutaceae bacterium]|nr:type IX secretion system membrane protein PorP/SprF [Cytophagales bacterium]
MSRILFIIFFVFFLRPGWCQLTNVISPDLYSRYDVNMYMVNAAYLPDNAKTDLTAYYKFQTGEFTEVATLTCSAAKLYTQKNNSVHSIRLTASNEKQGPYISSPRGYANYALEVPLGETVKLAVGVAGGFISMHYTGVSAAGNINFFLPDASAGSVLKWNRLQFGFAGLQLLNSKARPYAGQLEAKRYYHVHISDESDLDINWKWKYYGLYRILPLIPDEFLVGSSIFYRERIGIGSIYRSNSGISLYTEFSLDSETDRINITFNYNSSFFKLVPAFQNSIELGVGYVLH